MTSPSDLLQDWLVRFDSLLQTGDPTAVMPSFAPDCFWRDLVAFTWNLTTCEIEGTGPLICLRRQIGRAELRVAAFP